MKRAVDKNELKTVLKHAAVMLNELRTGLLLPKSYYDLFMRVCDELHVLEMYFADVVANGKSVVELYQQVQHWYVFYRLWSRCFFNQKKKIGGVEEFSRNISQPVHFSFFLSFSAAMFYLDCICCQQWVLYI